MNATKTAKKKPPVIPTAQASEAVAPTPLRPDWDFWRRRGYCRIWKAALLSLNIEPSNANRKTLKASHAAMFSEYEKRKEIMAINRGLHPRLPAVPHVREGRALTEKYVSLESLLALAIEQKWASLREFESGLREGAGGESRVHTPMLDEDEDEPEDISSSKGSRYAHQRLGAALELIEQILTGDRYTNKNKFLNGEVLNQTAIAEQIAAILEKHGVVAGKKVHGIPGVRRAVGNALSSLRAYE